MKNTQQWNTSHRAQLATSRGPWKSTRTDTFLLSQVGQEKEEAKGRGEEVGWGLHPGRDMKVRSGLHIQGSPSSGSSVWTEGEPHSLWERTWQPACGSRTVRPAHRVLTPALPTQPERQAHHCRQGLGAKMWGSDLRPRQRTAVGSEETS